MEEQQNQPEEKITDQVKMANEHTKQTELFEVLSQQKYLQEKFKRLAQHHKRIAFLVFYLIIGVLALGLGVFIYADKFSENSSKRLQYEILEKMDSLKLKDTIKLK